jgi:glycosyltransferase involved in cell wall biosynthesis
MEMPSFYNKLDAIVVPSRTRSNWKEQFGRVIIEAMACGVPVIGSDSAAIPEVVGDDGLIFPEGQVEALAACLQHLIDDSKLRRILGERGRTRVLRQYTQAQVAAQTVKVYHEMLSAT